MHSGNRRGFNEKRKKRNRDEFHLKIEAFQEQGEQLQIIFVGIDNYNVDKIIEQLGNMDLIKAIEYVPIKFELLENIINFLKKFAQSRIGQVQQFARIILKSDLFKNLLYQICLTIYDQNSQIQIQQMVQLFKDLHSMFKICQSITDLPFSPIIIPIELIELVDQDYPKCELAKFFAEYHQLKEYLKTIRYSNDYIESPVEPIMLEFDFKSQIVGNLEKTNYLNYHYFILREDYLREFRQFIYKFKTKKKFEGTDRQFPLYQEAQLIDFNISNKDLIWTITLKQYDMDGRRRQIYDWKKSKRLTNGALLAFTNLQGYPIVFGVILDRDINQPNYKKKFEIQLSIKLLSNDILQFLDLFKTTNIVIENPIIYDVQTSYLQSLKTTKLPFNDIIVNGSKVAHFPNYIFNYNYTIYLSTTNDNNNNNNNNFNIQQFYSSRSYLSQIKQIEESQYLPRTNQVELEQDDDESANEFLDSDEEAKSRFFREDYAPQIKQHKSKRQENNLMKTMLNKRIPYDHKGIAELQNRQFNPWQLNKLDIRGILDYITHLMLLQDIQKYSSLVKQFEEMIRFEIKVLIGQL